MGGTIGVESEEGKGSKFTFTIALELDPSSDEGDKPPVMCSDVGLDTMMDNSDESTSVCLPETKRRRILVVDRHEKTKEALCDQIRAWGLDSLACSNVEEAIGILKESIDVGLPFHGMGSTSSKSYMDSCIVLISAEGLFFLILFFVVRVGSCYCGSILG